MTYIICIIIRVILKVTHLHSTMVPSFNYYVMCSIFFHPYKLVRIYIYVILPTCTIYILYAHIYTTIKIVSKAFLHLQARSFPFPRGSFSLFRTNEKRTKRKSRVSVCFCAILESTRHSASASRLYVWKITLFVTSF